MTSMTRTLSHATAPRRPLLERLADWQSLYRQRHALAALDAGRLRDLGLTAQQARAEASRPVWDAPATWRR
ncbi:hypothetical protein OCGS_1908 [Oceaniovalibus guishaninsula JLT2003]|uniref:YjiS-like domain-containing protein n=1 Tax=Oceaniovalibus guishaninsula JLT2003 TaxID=1231392 RepID=K2HBB2_9RHOB|nr:DUF1127 domain-containing protein [Oceaniovalibus guishaninsula]EKE43927.1 hypothetical protein OCGS_1908 [Oceaniovalibus guishaninsula JLT2003]